MISCFAAREPTTKRRHAVRSARGRATLLSAAAAIGFGCFGNARAARADEVWVSKLDVSKTEQSWGTAHADRSVEDHPLTVAGHVYEHGLGTHCDSRLDVVLGGAGQRFTAAVGVDDEATNGRAQIKFSVLGDGRVLASTQARSGDQAHALDVDVSGVKKLVLLANTTGQGVDNCHADWGDARLTYDGAAPVTIAAPVETAEILTPPAPATPRINSAKAFGVRQGHPVLYTVAATGDRPMTFKAEGLPQGATLDEATGHVSGAVATPGTYVVHLHATNALGTADRDVKFVVGDTIALTPPMGWNSWNCFAQAVSEEKVKAAADAMVSSGLIDHGWTYVNVDDCWEIPAHRPEDQRRAPDGHILTNTKFPDMKGMYDYIHAKGLRGGIYSSPGTSTCGNFTASYQHEQDDAEQYAKWGVDYLKYDWCSYSTVASRIKKGPNPPSQLEIDQHPYGVMRDALVKQDRDILFSFCQYGMGDVWKWGPEFGGNCWRTTGDISDNWASMTSNGFREATHGTYAGPGHWNDPDMLVVGKVGWGPSLHPTHLTPNEQYTHISLWCLASSPLLIGCDMTQLDDFTKSLLTNDEVLAVNQDPLGHEASRVKTDGGLEIWARELEDGSRAVGLFNRDGDARELTVKWADLKLDGKQTVRDLWRQKDVPAAEDGYTVTIPRHGCFLLKVTPAGR